MRTTLTLDPDVAAYIEKVRREDQLALKDIINSLLREAIRPKSKPKKPKPYSTPVHHGGKCLIDITDISEAIAQGEGEWHR